MNSIKQIRNAGQSLWIDCLTRSYLVSGKFESDLNEGITGLTSNPTILQKSIANTSDYDAEIDLCSRQDKDSMDLYEEIIRRDIAIAAQLLHRTYTSTDREDGYVSIEVDPAFAHRVDATIYQGAHLFHLIDRPNVMIKVPATDAGIQAFRQLIFEGINVNMTLLFSVSQYEKVARAYINALRDRLMDNRPLNTVASVASFFVSRIDTKIDRLDNIGEHKGKAAVLNAHTAYSKYLEIFHSKEFVELRKQGAMPQKLLWASTSVKNPEYNALKYVVNLLLKNTVNTLPPAVLESIIHYRNEFLIMGVRHSTYFADEHFDKLAHLGCDYNKCTQELLDEGLSIFSESFDSLMGYLYHRLSQQKGNLHASKDSES